jgi:hypothetical protein
MSDFELLFISSSISLLPHTNGFFNPVIAKEEEEKHMTALISL